MDKTAPRYQAGRLTMPKEAGDITGMCSCGDYLEIYTESETYKVKTPEAIDPEVTNPNAPWVSTKSSDFGSSSHVVARVLLQGSDMIKSSALDFTEAENEKLITRLHTCKESLLICDAVRERVTQSIETITHEIRTNGVELEHGRHVKNLPQVPKLEEQASLYLTNMKRAIVSSCYLVCDILKLSKPHSNVEHLRNSIESLNDEKYASFLGVLNEFVLGTKHLIELRNYQEHPGNKKTIIENFTITPENEISSPVWYVTADRLEYIEESMNCAIDYAISLSETLLAHSLLLSPNGKLPLCIEAIREEDIDPKKPIKYRVSIDINAINITK